MSLIIDNGFQQNVEIINEYIAENMNYKRQRIRSTTPELLNVL